MKKKRIGILGSGSWATALVKILSENTLNLNWFIRNPKTVDQIRSVGRNPRYLSYVDLNLNKLHISSDINKVINDSEILIIAIPSPFIESSLISSKKLISKKILVSASKGIIPESFLTISEHLNREYNIPKKNLAIISGPSHAEEVAQEKLTYLTVGTNNLKLGEHISSLLNTKYIISTVSRDMTGIEISSSLKNIYSIMVGIAHGLGYGDNFISVLISHSSKEMSDFIEAIHKIKRKINHSAYLGDLLVTTYSSFSRNRTFGNMIGKGYSINSAKAEMNMIVEGYYATKNASLISKKLSKKFLIIDVCHKILFENRSANKQIRELSKELY
ncbi:MAG: glycerol-3-phosphate dehydrogenase [Cryomorphaceae bacterium]|nr:MAG: glycerol-3-phosphate dehydrogenase [Cryomorphaceae bacterium]